MNLWPLLDGGIVRIRGRGELRPDCLINLVQPFHRDDIEATALSQRFELLRVVTCITSTNLKRDWPAFSLNYMEPRDDYSDQWQVE